MITVVNKHKHTPTEYDIYIGRGSILGNPYTCRPINTTKANHQVNSAEESISSYEQYLLTKIKEKDPSICKELNRIYKLCKEGREINLVCFCKPKPCHGDVIKTIINKKL